MGTDLGIRRGPEVAVDESLVDVGREEGPASRIARAETLAWPPTSPAVSVGVRPRARAKRVRAFGKRFWRDLCLGGSIVMLVHIFVVQISVVRGLSMSPSLQDGDRLMVDRVSYAVTDVSRFDVVVLRYPRNPSIDFVKRVIGLPGDWVVLSGGVLCVNGEAVAEDFAHVADINAMGSWTVPKGKYFVLGDNRPVSCDSREFGMVDHKLLRGKVRMRFWPLSRFAMF